MEFLIVGVILFVGIHLLPTQLQWRNQLVERLGLWNYQGLFSLVALLGFGLMLYGYSQSPFRPLWSPLPMARPLAMLLMPLAFVLLIAAYVPCHIRLWLRHPMLIATALWAVLHLLANGDLASSLLFGGFLFFALVDMWLAKPYPNLIPQGRPRGLFDLLALVGGVLAYAAVLHLHRALFGVPVLY